MVKVLAPGGNIMHEPLYTEAEEHALYRAMSGGPMRVLRTSRPRLKVSPPQKSQEEPPSQ
jgi:hypothetical protein